MSEGGLKQAFFENRPALLRYLRARGLTPESAEDLLQDVFVKLQSAPTGPVGEPSAYLYRMTHNLLLDQRRSAMRRRAREEAWQSDGTSVVVEADTHPSAEQILISRQRLDAMKVALRTLPVRTQDIFYRFRIEGETQKVIAASLGISKSAVEKHIYRAYRLVSEVKADLESEDPEKITTLLQGIRHNVMKDDYDA